VTTAFGEVELKHSPKNEDSGSTRSGSVIRDRFAEEKSNTVTKLRMLLFNSKPNWRVIQGIYNVLFSVTFSRNL
jgi:hypothetical protein